MSAARKPRVAVGGDDQDLGRSGDEVDAHFARQQFLGGGHIDVARADDAIGARHRARAEGESRDGLRAAHLENAARTPSRCAVPRISGTGRGTGHANVRHAGHLRRNHGHHQRGGQRIAARGNIGGRPYRAAGRPAQLQAGAAFRAAIPAGSCISANARILAAAVATAARKSADRPAHARSSSASGTATDLRSSPSNWRAYSSSALIAALAHGVQDRPHHGLGLAPAGARCGGPAGDPILRLSCAESRIIIARSCSADTPRSPARPLASAAG